MNTPAPPPLISVIVPMYRAAATIDRCLDALLEQEVTGRTVELLLVDNNCPDDTAARVRKHIERVGPDRLQLLHQPRQGAYAARNHAVSLARGDLLVFTDPDCVAPAGWLGRLVAPFRNPTVHAVQGPAPPPATTGDLWLLGVYEIQKERLVFASDDPTVYYAHTNNFATRHETFERLGPFLDLPRGADAMYLRTLVDDLGVGAAVHVPDAPVEHLEIDSLHTYYGKIETYGNSATQYDMIRPLRNLTQTERLRAYFSTVAAYRLGPIRAARLLMLLSRGVSRWNRGHRGSRTDSPATASSPSA